ncbi:hypothetical protein Y032_0041g369 [Ancylostoma ceylanicum]|uniref:7TM GPCR serpentine receptor class x (Srx) domain-containing protein n=1 Tax=Ancylostoma ceylanicum TaxID=53326 RepID=A0A016UGW4_9BILA|nr:hypothetical protein Y032_0041g369 [Ancylostoma ceylanicum]
MGRRHQCPLYLLHMSSSKKIENRGERIPLAKLIFYRRSEFHSVLAYRLMFWIGVADVGQLIILSLSGIMAITQNGFFHFYFNKFCGSTLYALWFAMLFLSIVITLNRFISIVLSAYYSTIFNKFNVNLVYAAAALIFFVSWIVKLTPYSSYYFDPKLLKWTYHKNDVKILSRLSHYFGTYAILVQVLCSVIAYTIIAVYIFSRRKKVMKCSEIVLTTQHFLMSLLFFFGFLYWEFIDTWLERTVIVNFFSTLIWVIIAGLNPIIYLSVNRRLRLSVYGLVEKRKRMVDRTVTVIPFHERTKMSSLVMSMDRMKTRFSH